MPEGHRWQTRCTHLYLHTLLCLAAIFGITGATGGVTPPENLHHFHFTHPLYNATIPEKAPGKSYISSTRKMGIFVQDDITSIKYKIIEGDHHDYFRAEEHRVSDFCFLRVRTLSSSHGVLNREREDSYHLKVRAIASTSAGAALTATTDVLVNVLDENDLSPFFEPDVYNVSIGEDLPLHSSIVQVTAFDGDVGINAEIYFSLETDTRTFAIHPTTGILSLTRHLSVLEQKDYDLTVLAQDRGPKTFDRKPNKAKIYISVEEANFYSPEILVTPLPAIVENSAYGAEYAVLTVQDQDIGINGLISAVYIVHEHNSTNMTDMFQIIPSEGPNGYKLIVTRPLDKETAPDGYDVTIEAKDSGDPPKTSRKTIHVNILDINDNKPLFQHEEFHVIVPENVPIGTSVIYLKASDKDFGRNAEVTYSIESGNKDKLFDIHKDTGLIVTVEKLDAESVTSVVLLVAAEDHGNKDTVRRGTTRVNITISDCNDNDPSFNLNQTLIRFDENLPVGSQVFVFNASDADSGLNGQVTYAIANIDDVPFSIDHFSGVITVTQSMDYETMKRSYVLMVRASDSGLPFRRVSETVLTMELSNVNDKIPVWEKVNCSGYLSREAPADTNVAVVTAIDFDGDMVTYQIVAGNEDDCFHVARNTGVIRLNCSLLDTQDEHRILSLVASDGKFTSAPVTLDLTLVNNKRSVQLSNKEANIQCHPTNVSQQLAKQVQTMRDNNAPSEGQTQIPRGQDKNLHAPVFKFETSATMEISEGFHRGREVMTLTAEDEDQGYNGRVSYAIVAGDPHDQFSIGYESGKITVAAPLDRETIDKYTLSIVAVDQAKEGFQKSSTATVEILLLDDNDNSPIFEHDKYEVSVSEGYKINATVAQVIAHDIDLGPNGHVMYSFPSKENMFAIYADSGIVTVKRELDREKQATYFLPIKAVDHGLPARSSTTTLTIHIQDENDNRPHCIPELYDIRIREDLPVGTVVAIITAEDPDLGVNGAVTYSLAYGTEDKFDIDEETGVIRMTQKLDFESQQIYNLSVVAQDGGGLESVCLVNVEIVDVYEVREPLVFSRFFQDAYVREGVPVGSYVTQVLVQGWEELESHVTYSLRDGSGLGRFTIDNNGTIRTHQVLDRETASHYWLTVYAQDHAPVPQHARLEVNVKVMDVNDNIPQFVQPVYYMEVPENSKSGVTVGQVAAYDADNNPAQRLEYSITSGDTPRHFRIDRYTGVITTTKVKLDREAGPEIRSLEITVQDNGNPNLSSVTRVDIRILDENDNAPEFEENRYNVRALSSSHATQPRPIIRVLALDRDAGDNGQVTYRIRGKETPEFSINRRSGMIYAVQPLQEGSYSLKVRAVDGGKNRKRAVVQVRIYVIPRPISSSNPPIFDQREYQFDPVAENRPVGSLVGLVAARDQDGEKLWYYITGGDEEELFNVRAEEGSIKVARPLDRETKDIYNLTITVTDGVHQDQAHVIIRVLDFNDNAPVFTQTLYEFTVPENASVGSVVAQVSAQDRDIRSRLFFTIVAVDNDISSSNFVMNSETGEITLQESLDREVRPQYQLTVMVRDQGTQSHRNFSYVNILVQDHNDHAPQFLETTVHGKVFETAAVGTAVVELVAIDYDKGSNAEITYSISTGNIGQVFEIEETLGIITVAKQLDRSIRADYSLVVIATDHGAPPLSSSVTVSVQVTVSNNAAPKFSAPGFMVELQENVPVGTVVYALQATCQSSILFDITDGNEDEVFGINSNSGLIYTRLPVDYETNTNFNLTISATNMVGVSSQVKVAVLVQDLNDNAPEFDQVTFEGKVSELAPVGSVILTSDLQPLVVHATDLDSYRNAHLTYQINDLEARKYFAIDSVTGAIKTIAPLDHEKFDQMTFFVHVVDKGTPQLQAKDPALVSLNIIDMNDNPPTFSKQAYHAHLMLPTGPGVFVLRPFASDLDSINQQSLTYSILNDQHEFRINVSDGTITVRDSEKIKGHHSLKLQVTDGKFETFAFVEVETYLSTVPGFRFKEDVFMVEVQENTVMLQPLTIVQVEDDISHRHLAFTLLNHKDRFSITQTSGIIQALGRGFDREEQNHYKLIVKVEDMDNTSLVANAVVEVRVRDENDNQPQFVNQPYDTVIAVGLRAGELVRQVTAIDRDEDLNGEVRYSILLPVSQHLFRINASSGHITLARPLTPSDEGHEMWLTVRANDLGIPSQHMDVNVTVTIVSDDHPRFPSPLVEFEVNEDVVPLTTIGTVQALSPNGHKLLYTITQGDIYHEFAIDFNIAVLSVASPLDYEETKQYNLTLEATDVTTKAKATTLVCIKVKDVNDHAPQFNNYKYTAVVSEAISVGTSVVWVHAQDEDTGPSGMVRYELSPLVPGNDDVNYFTVDLITGLVTSARVLDHEKQTSYTFLAVARDQGIPSLESHVTVHVILQDMNDNPPTFDLPAYDCSVTSREAGQIVTKVTASDPDTSSQENLLYAIVGGNDEQIFHMNPASGVITLARTTTEQLYHTYMLNVSVTDGVFTSFTRVGVNIRDRNMHSPQFTETKYTATIMENLGPGTLVTTVTATDADQGNNGLPTYSIMSDHLGRFFSIDADTGDVYTRQMLDRETRDSYEIPIAATDNGGRMGFSTLEVTVTDINDNIPQFSARQYTAVAHADAPVNSSVLQVKAFDRDVGQNGQVMYTMYNDTAKEFLFIDGNTGIIYIRKSLTFSEHSTLQFFVTAVDQGELSLENNVPVMVVIMPQGEVPPRFPQSRYIFVTSENSDRFNFLRTITADSQQPVEYSIVSGNLPEHNTPEAFSVDQAGNIHLNMDLDTEQTPLYSLTLMASTLTSPPLVAHTEVNFQIRGVNDNTPQFESNPYRVTLVENSEPGTQVLQVRAFDLDNPSSLEYKFEENMTQIQKLFSIDRSSGWITLLGTLDRETTSHYNISLVVIDTDMGVTRQNKTTVQIRVTDFNDNPPVFSRDHYQSAVNELAPPGTVVISLNTTDADDPRTTEVIYHIVEGDHLGKFQMIGPNVCVSKQLDRESVPQYSLQVAATDGALVTMTTVTIDILDDNDNSPICEQPIHNKLLSEDISRSEVILQVQAHDHDDASTSNAQVHYLLKNESDQQVFTVDATTGILTVFSNLDRETVSSYHIIVSAVDGGQRSCDTDIYIQLTDVNDNVPEFVDTPTALLLPEDAQPNTLLLRVTARDADLGINRQIKYRLSEDADGTFAIDEELGVIQLMKAVDRETVPMYHIGIQAYDQGQPSLTAETRITVTLQDVNDNPPEFVRTSYLVSVPEDIPIGQDLMKVKATSKDIGINAQMLYTIAGGNMNHTFSIDEETGLIRLEKFLDYEHTREYILTVTAHDKSPTPLTSSTYVKISVTDVNDNKPMFSQSLYSVKVNESETVGTVVLKVTASDADSAELSQLTYTIADGDKMENFLIDRNTGTIRVRTPLDRESVSRISMVVRAVDSVPPRYYGETVVQVDVMDTNDCAPRFTEDAYSAVIQEDRLIGHRILAFMVNDDDLYPNGAPFGYDIIAGNEGGEFRVNTDGHLVTASRFNHKIKDMYQLTVRVFDNGTPSLFSDVPVEIKIIEEGTHPPNVGNLSVSVNAFHDQLPGNTFLGQIQASDEDLFDRLNFEIVSHNRHLFDIGKRDGRLFNTEDLDAGKYVINVSVSDGRYTRYGTADLRVDEISRDVVANSVTVQFQNLDVQDFLQFYRRMMQKFLRKQLNIKMRDVIFLNIQPSQDLDYDIVSARVKRDASQNLDVLLAVRESPGTFMAQSALVKKLTKLLPEMEEELGLKVLRLLTDICTPSSCPQGQCEGVIDFDEGGFHTMVVNGETYVLTRHTHSYTCLCKDGSPGISCEQTTKSTSCPPGQTCSHQPAICNDFSCQTGTKPMTFSGHSYAKWRLHDSFKIDRKMRLSLRIKTIRQMATLVFAAGKKDYNILEVFHGMVQYRFDCGSGEGLIRIPIFINNGEWHSLIIVREGRRAELMLDNTYSSFGEAPGTNDYLNLDNNDIYFGAEVRVSYNGEQDIVNGFEGCMESLQLFGVPMAFEGSNAVVQSQQFSGVQFQCKESGQQILSGSNICSTFPCLNGGKCESSGINSYICSCPDRFSGNRCEIDSDPCANDPCMNGGKCENVRDDPNEFLCKCAGNLKGKFCSYGASCLPNPCLNGGACVEGPSVNDAQCVCTSGFEGRYCDKKLDECAFNPCLHGGTCHKASTSLHYFCNCTEGRGGHHCENILRPAIASSPSGITREEVLAIVGACLGILILVMIFVIIQCCRRRYRNRRHANITGGVPGSEVEFRGMKETKIFKGGSYDLCPLQETTPPSPRPPPVPNRPASYTPSNHHDSLNALNNFDLVRNYGSAADDLEADVPNISYLDYLKTLQTFAPLPPKGTASVAPSLPPPPPSNSDTDSIQKPQWEADYPNMLESHEEKKHPEKLLQNGYLGPNDTSYSSLPLSESEDEPGKQRQKKEYHWDASDWAQRPSLPNISEVPSKEVPDSPRSSPHSNESNTHITSFHNNIMAESGVYTDPEMMESEYVGDSEYADNDCEDYPSPPSYHHLLGQGNFPEVDLGIQGGGEQLEDIENYHLPQNMHMHPNYYLPQHSPHDQSGEGEAMLSRAALGTHIGGYSDSEGEDNDGNCVVQYGFPNRPPPRVPELSITDSEGQGDLVQSPSLGDDLSVSGAGPASTNVSFSDISGLCDIDDSEVNHTDEDEEYIDENTPLKIHRFDTQV